LGNREEIKTPSGGTRYDSDYARKQRAETKTSQQVQATSRAKQILQQVAPEEAKTVRVIKSLKDKYYNQQKLKNESFLKERTKAIDKYLEYKREKAQYTQQKLKNESFLKERTKAIDKYLEETKFIDKGQPTIKPVNDYTPERNKGPQETIDKTTSLDYGFDNPVLKISKTIPKETQTAKKETISKKELNTLYEEGKDFEWKKPIKSFREGAELWGASNKYQEERVLGNIKTKQTQTEKTLNQVYDLTSSQETISPSSYTTKIETYNKNLQSNSLGFKESAVLITAPVFFGVAETGQEIYTSILHPYQTAKGMANAVTDPWGTGKALTRAFIEDPIKMASKTATSVYIYSKFAEGGLKTLKVVNDKTPHILHSVGKSGINLLI